VNLIVGVSDMQVSNDTGSTIVTYSLGSCIGIVIYDPVVKVGGMLHFMLPESSLDPEKARKNPYMFCDTGIPSLFKAAYKLGAQKQRIKVIVVGGSQVLDQKGFFNIGKRNCLATKKMLFKNNVIINYEDVGGISNRTIRLAVNNGRTSLRVSGQEEVEI